MLSYCWKYKENTVSKNPKLQKQKTEKMMLSSNSVVSGSKKKWDWLKSKKLVKY